MEKEIGKVLDRMKVCLKVQRKSFKTTLQDQEYRVVAFKCPPNKEQRENLYVIVSRDGLPNATNRIDSWKENDVIDFVGNKEELKVSLQNLQDMPIINPKPASLLDKEVHSLLIMSGKLSYVYSHQQVN